MIRFPHEVQAFTRENAFQPNRTKVMAVNFAGSALARCWGRDETKLGQQCHNVAEVVLEDESCWCHRHRPA